MQSTHSPLLLSYPQRTTPPQFTLKKYVDGAMEGHDACIVVHGSQKSGKAFATMGKTVNASEHSGGRREWDVDVGMVPRALVRSVVCRKCMLRVSVC
jgi:hypothetical protein